MADHDLWWRRRRSDAGLRMVTGVTLTGLDAEQARLLEQVRDDGRPGTWRDSLRAALRQLRRETRRAVEFASLPATAEEALDFPSSELVEVAHTLASAERRAAPWPDLVLRRAVEDIPGHFGVRPAEVERVDHHKEPEPNQDDPEQPADQARVHLGV